MGNTKTPPAAQSSALSLHTKTSLQHLGSELQTILQSLPETEADLWVYLTRVALEYRYQMPIAELMAWVEKLKSFPLTKVQRAVDWLQKNAPREYAGMPNVVEVIRVISDLDAADAAQAKLDEAEEESRKLSELEKRREQHPEEFFGMSDLLDLVKEKFPDAPVELDRERKPVPVPLANIPAPMTDEAWEARRKLLRQQAIEAEKRFSNAE